MGRNRPSIAAVVCTRNRAGLLDGTLGSLQHQSLPTDRYEVLVIDNASTDGTADVVKRHQAWSPHIRYFYEPKLGISNARNRGIAEAEAPIIAYTDDDALADDAWLEAVLAAFARTTQRPLAVGGRIVLDWGSRKRPRWLPDSGLLTLGSLDHGDASITCRYAYDLFGSNLAFERAYLAASGGFNCRLGRADKNLISGEETEMLARLQTGGGLLLYEPAAVVTHLVHADRLSLRWFARRTYAQGITDSIMDEFVASSTLRPEADGSFVSRFLRRVALSLRLHNTQVVFLWTMSAAYRVGRWSRLLRRRRVGVQQASAAQTAW